jgi:hypothetical protein
MNIIEKIKSWFHKEPKCTHEWIEILSLPLTKEFKWSDSHYIGDGQYSYAPRAFTGTAFLVFTYCPICKQSSYTCASPYDRIPYTEYYIYHLIKDMLKENVNDSTDHLNKILLDKCKEHDYIWDETNGAFYKKTTEAPANIERPGA